MSLRINTNLPALAALRALRINDRLQTRSLERLSTGLRINHASDDPGGLVISEQLRSQIAALQQAGENSQNALNLINTADAGLQEIADLLVQIQDSIIFSLNTAGASPDQIAAEQDAVDQAVASIDRIANTTRYGNRQLLNGASGYQLLGSEPLNATGTPMFNNIRFRTVEFSPGATQRSLSLLLTRNPARAEIVMNNVTSAVGTIIRITGSRGTADVALGDNTPASAATATTIADAISTVAPSTGVFAVATGNNVSLFSEDMGSSQLIRIEGIAGSLGATSFQVRDNAGALVAPAPNPGVAITVGEAVSDTGLDAQLEFQGLLFTAAGRRFDINTRDISFEFELNSDVYPPIAAAVPALAAYTLTVGNTGLNFQLGDQSTPADRMGVGIEGVTAALLGTRASRDVITEAATLGAQTFTRGGFLSTVRTGGGNDLTQNAGNAQVITRAAINQVAALRGFLGAVGAYNLEPNIDSIAVRTENLNAALSDIRDLDFAEETANFARAQVLYQSGIAVLASANLIPQSVLTLLA